MSSAVSVRVAVVVVVAGVVAVAGVVVRVVARKAVHG
ncbi:hypothetical protein SAXI111661_04055 [Saccharomonospora xinjiangensis]|nr:hypothetical protein EYD13_06460 [Saccharomonospora xinjiangensis]